MIILQNVRFETMQALLFKILPPNNESLPLQIDNN